MDGSEILFILKWGNLRILPFQILCFIYIGIVKKNALCTDLLGKRMWKTRLFSDGPLQI